MSAQTGIEWCDSTFNPWMGCTKVSPACDHCYAERETRRFGRVEWGAGKPRVRTTSVWNYPARWNRETFVECDCGYRGTLDQLTTNAVHRCNLKFRPARRRVFCASLADWLDNEVPIEWLVDLLDLIRRTPNLDWLLLTKRIGNWRTRLGAALNASNSIDLREWIALWLHGDAPRNVWIGSTVIDQPETDRDVPKLLAVPALVRFLSIEPMLGPIEFSDVSRRSDCAQQLGKKALDGIDWIIAGGESGPQARPSHPDWYRSLRDQCAAVGVPFLFKQHGEWLATDFCSDEDVMLPSRRTVYVNRDGSSVDGSEGFDFFAGFKETAWVGKKAAGRLLDGRTHDGFPAVLP